jgi:hypothetical protein
MLQLTSTGARKRVYSTCSSTVSFTTFRNHVLEAKAMFECWITEMTVYYNHLIMVRRILFESVTRPQVTQRRIEGDYGI